MNWRILAVILVTSALAASGCQKECKPNEDAACWIAALKNAETASKALDNLKTIGDKQAEPALIDLFVASANEPELRERLAEIFKKWGTKAAAKPMIDALDFTVGPNKDGKKAARTNRANQKIASALGTLGDPAASQPMLRLLKATKEPNVQRAAIRALADLKAKDAVDEMIRISEDTTVLQVIRLNTIYALGEIGDPKAVPTLVQALYREKAYYFSQANLALVKIGEPAIDLLVKTMNGENPDAKKITEANVEILAGALEGNSAKVLGDIGSPLAVEPILKMVEKVAKWEEETNRLLVLTRLFNALGVIGDTRGTKPIMEYLAKEPEKYWDVRLVCTIAINNIGDRQVVPELFKLISKGGHPRARIPLIEAIGNLGTAEALPQMKQLAAEEKDVTAQPVVQESVKKLEAYAQCNQDAGCWMGKLNDPSVAVREKAIYELGRLGEAKAVDELVKLVGHDSEAIRYALIFAFDKLGLKKPAAAIEEQIDKEKGSPRFAVVNHNYKFLVARLNRSGK